MNWRQLVRRLADRMDSRDYRRITAHDDRASFLRTTRRAPLLHSRRRDAEDKVWPTAEECDTTSEENHKNEMRERKNGKRGWKNFSVTNLWYWEVIFIEKICRRIQA